MSIINDALKKAEKEKKSVSHPQISLTNTLENLKRDTQRFALRKYLFWTSTGVFCLLGVVLLISNNAQIPKKTPRENISLPPIAVQENSGQTISAADSPAIFRLSGIIFEKEKPLAIINEAILTEGGFIDGAEVVEICPDSVKLSFKDTELVLEME